MVDYVTREQHLPVLALVLLVLSCTACNTTGSAQSGLAASSTIECDPENGSIALPEGFCAVVVADGLGPARHLVVRENGDIYVKLRSAEEGGGIVALRDTDGDGQADVTERFGEVGGTGIGIHDGHLYYSSETAVYRQQLSDDALVPQGERETVIDEFPEQGQHAAKSFTFDESGHIYVNVGAPSNACQEQMRTADSPGQDPCPQLERQAGVWRFDANALGQTQQADGERYVTGIRNSVALDWNPFSDNLYIVQHGRDQLHTLWPDLYTTEESAELPSEEFLLAAEGANFGWPYCYNDHLQGQKVLAPEYGGDGEQVGRCDQFEAPIMAFPGHFAPNDLHFYTGGQFPDRFRQGAFIAFHGSWNRAPQPQRGYRVTYVPFDGAQPSGGRMTFADGFIGQETIKAPGDAEFRPMGLAEGPDGSLYLTDSQEGRLWRIIYRGSE